MRWKKIYVNRQRTRYVIVRLYATKKEMQEAYYKLTPKDKDHDKCIGVHIPFIEYTKTGRKENIHPRSGIVLLHTDRCGAGVVSHELSHAVLFAWKHSSRKKQFPIVIKSMEEEEEILHNLTYAVSEFYRWFYKVTEPNGNRNISR